MTDQSAAAGAGQSQPEQQASQLTGTVRIGDRTIDIASLPDSARRNIQALRFAEAEINNLKLKLALAETAKKALAASLQNEIAAAGV